MQSINDPQLYRAAKEYISYLDRGIIDKMGYAYDEIINLVNTYKPDINIAKYSIGIDSIMKNTREVMIESKRLKTLLDQRDKKIRNQEYLLGNLRKP